MPSATPEAIRSTITTTTIEPAGITAQAGPRSRASHGNGCAATSATSDACTSDSTQIETAKEGTPSR